MLGQTSWVVLGTATAVWFWAHVFRSMLDTSYFTAQMRYIAETRRIPVPKRFASSERRVRFYCGYLFARLTLLRALQTFVPVMAPAMLVLIPIRGGAMWESADWPLWFKVADLGFMVFWMKEAWDETKRNWPRNKKKLKKLLTKVQVKDGRLSVVPIKS